MMRGRVGAGQMYVALRDADRASGANPPLVLLHGFTGSSTSWQSVAGWLGRERRLVMPDLLGHGRSDAPSNPAPYALECQVVDLLALLDELALERVCLLGYSMGGRIALRLALAAPDRVSALVLESASPGIVDPAERAARQNADEALADSLQRQGLETFIDRWERQPLFASQQRLPATTRAALRAQRARSSVAGLSASLRGAGAAAAEPVWSRLSLLPVPTLVIAGDLDRKYVGISRAMARVIPHCQLEIVPETGHAVHLERPEYWTEIVLSFLEECN
jgi:2-succinyl-6-hydroxy-2,4-cyclohexadiene-1-carboxylate synthase